MDIPALTTYYAPGLSTRAVNINEDMEFNVSMPNAENVDFSTALIYDYDIVGIVRFSFTTMRVRIWNYFSNFKEKTDFTLRISGYDP
jgi:hypothetical protein